MTDLDAKLQKELEDYYNRIVMGEYEGDDTASLKFAIAQIHQAFAEAGYVVLKQGTPVYPKNEASYLTGQEWYSKLAKHLNKYDWTTDEKDSILQAAFEVAEGLV